MSPRVLVTDGAERAALAVVRSLGKAGHRTIVCGSSRRTLAGASRYSSHQAVVPSPLTEPARFVDEVRRLVSERAVDFVVPVSEAALLALLPARASLSAVIPWAAGDSFRRISDKAIVLESAQRVGIAVPKQQSVANQESDDWKELPKLGFPLVLKPTRSIAGGLKLGVRHVAGPGELEMTRLSIAPEAYPILAQRRIIGPGIGIFLLVWDGEMHAVFAHRRIREKPPAGGVSVYRESIAADPGLVARSCALLDQFDWRGVAMIEYKLDEQTGTPYLMEINGRFWGSLQLAVDAGVDFPSLLIALARGERPAPVTNYRTGVRSRWWWGDMDHLLVRLLHSNRQLDLPAGAPGRMRAVLDFLTLWRPGDRSEVFRWGDPRPAWRETLNWFRGQ